MINNNLIVVDNRVENIEIMLEYKKLQIQLLDRRLIVTLITNNKNKGQKLYKNNHRKKKNKSNKKQSNKKYRNCAPIHSPNTIQS